MFLTLLNNVQRLFKNVHWVFKKMFNVNFVKVQYVSGENVQRVFKNSWHIFEKKTKNDHNLKKIKKNERTLRKIEPS